MALVDYPSSDSGWDSESDSDQATDAPPAKRARPTSEAASASTSASTSRTRSATPAQAPAPKPRRALPRLPDTFSGLSAHDNAAQHQGRVRARPFVEGDYYAHVYIELAVPNSLRRALDGVVAAARGHVPEGTELHPLYTGMASGNGNDEDEADDEGSLHISLTHPLALRRDAAATFPAAVRAALAGPGTTPTSSFRVSLATLAAYCNAPAPTPTASASPSPAPGPSTPTPTAPPPQPRRAFLALRVGAGVPPLRALVQRIAANPAVRFAHDRRSEGVYFSDAEFHASFAWWLDHSRGDEDGSGMASALEAEFGERVRAAQPRGGWEVRAVCVKVAKEVTRVVLR